MHLLLTRELLVEHLAAPNESSSTYARIQERARQAGDQLWVHMAILPDLCTRAAERFAQTSGSVGREHAIQMASERFRRVLEDCQMLASLPDEAPLMLGESSERALAAHAAKRLGPRARILVREASPNPPLELTPEDYLAQPLQYTPIPFIDLERQQHHLRAGLETAMHRVLHHGQYILGPEIDELERQLAAYVGVKHAITVASGTDALLIALMALNIRPGDEVITVPYTWISTAEVIALLRAKPVFVDIEWDTMNMDPRALERAITPRTRAIMPVGIYGQCADMTAINRIADQAGIPVIEDAAQCFGATHRGRRSCGLSLIGCTSFFPSKPLGCYGDGGAMFTSDDALAETIRQIRVHGQKVKHQHPIVGINGRMDTLQAAIVIEKLKVFDEECRLRNEVASRYSDLLRDVPGLVTPTVRPENTSVWAQYTIRIPDPDGVCARLQKAGIPSVSYYKGPLHLQGAFADLGHRPGDFPVTERVAAQCLSLPMSPHLTAAEQVRITDVIRSEQR